MNDSGYVYVLMNPSMAGLVKIGKTKRDPSGRVAELSAATGVPTPFVLVYSTFFNRCSKAEEFVHTLLGGKGYRISNNREFFNAPVNQVIDAVMKAKETAWESDSGNDEQDNVGFTQNSDTLIQDLLREAGNYDHGRDDYLEDKSKATQLYLQAARLGSGHAYTLLGIRCSYQDQQQALRYFEEAIKLGDLRTYIYMADVYLGEKHHSNFQKCHGKYFGSRDFQDQDSSEKAEDFWKYYDVCRENSLPLQHIDHVLSVRDEIWESRRSAHQYCTEHAYDIPSLHEQILQSYLADLQFIDKLLFGGSKEKERMLKEREEAKKKMRERIRWAVRLHVKLKTYWRKSFSRSNT